MRVLLQIITVLLALYFIRAMLSGRTSHKARAFKKIGFVLLVLGMVLSVFLPWLTDMLAHAVGVGSGVNLFVYSLGIGFFMFALNFYLQEKDARDSITRLSRRIAILEAKERHGKALK
mgnify:CR=1 FL=1|jgi:hypothetical protein